MQYKLRTYSNAEYYAMAGSRRRNRELNTIKASCGVKEIEGNSPTAKMADVRGYCAYISIFFLLAERLCLPFATIIVHKKTFTDIKVDSGLWKKSPTCSVIVGRNTVWSPSTEKTKTNLHFIQHEQPALHPLPQEQSSISRFSYLQVQLLYTVRLVDFVG